MDELVSRSLAKRYLPSNDQQFDSYGIHDLQLSYLKECQSDSELTDKHKVSSWSLILGKYDIYIK